MPVRIGASLSTSANPRAGAEDAAAAARQRLGAGGRDPACDLAVVFASGTHLAAPEAVLEAVADVLSPSVMLGCGAQGVLGRGTEVEEGTAVAVWAASLGAGTATPFRATVEDDDEPFVEGLPGLEGASGAILLADPAGFPAEGVLGVLTERVPGVPVLGGVASARLPDGESALFLGEEVVDGGAVGIRLDGVDVAPCVSQGAAPIGPELTVTAAEGNVILELAGRPAYERLRQVIEELEPADTAKLARSGGVLLGIVVDPNKPDYLQGDFLVRPLIGADRLTGALAVGALVRPGQVIRVHVRDAQSADTDLREALEAGRRALAAPPAGALVFACNGRGRAMFGEADHDAAIIEQALGGAPAAGFFAAGEIGPVAGECHVHGFTATLALFS